MKQLADWQQRVVDEHAHEKEKLIKLTAFVHSDAFGALAKEDQLLLEEQRAAMNRFVRILQRRIHRFQGMKAYTCHKQVLARPMTRGDYNKLQGWTMPEGENPDDPGYLVEYLDGGKPNHPDFNHYISWSPKDVFEAGYTENS